MINLFLDSLTHWGQVVQRWEFWALLGLMLAILGMVNRLLRIRRNKAEWLDKLEEEMIERGIDQERL